MATRLSSMLSTPRMSLLQGLRVQRNPRMTNHQWALQNQRRRKGGEEEEEAGKRGIGYWRKGWKQEQRDGALLAQQYRDRVRLTQAFHQAAQAATEAYSHEALERSRQAAIVQPAEPQWPPWNSAKKTWSQHTRADAARPHWKVWQTEQGGEETCAASPMHPDIWPTKPPSGLQSKSKGCSPGESMQQGPVPIALPTPITPMGPPPSRAEAMNILGGRGPICYAYLSSIRSHESHAEHAFLNGCPSEPMNEPRAKPS